MSSFEVTLVTIEVIVGDYGTTSVLTAIRHRKTQDDLDFHIIGCWLDDPHLGNVVFPTEKGYYRMDADWNETKEVIESIYNIRKIQLVEETEL